MMDTHERLGNKKHNDVYDQQGVDNTNSQ